MTLNRASMISAFASRGENAPSVWVRVVGGGSKTPYDVAKSVSWIPRREDGEFPEWDSYHFPEEYVYAVSHRVLRCECGATRRSLHFEGRLLMLDPADRELFPFLVVATAVGSGAAQPPETEDPFAVELSSWNKYRGWATLALTQGYYRDAWYPCAGGWTVWHEGDKVTGTYLPFRRGEIAPIPVVNNGADACIVCPTCRSKREEEGAAEASMEGSKVEGR